MYSATVMDHFQNPRNVGELPDADAVGKAGSPTCGDILRLYLKIENGRVARATFKTFGCGAAIAASSILTTMALGKTVPQLRTITNLQVAEALGGLPPMKMHCSVLAEQALASALANL
ncbi:MAG: iron-sulfur cluster assembly scaffold protein [Elusimicrobia bacterium]|nr:iron-sulfur cluster assembly scaffold protein [Elusimicrobiota bacterium]